MKCENDLTAKIYPQKLTKLIQNMLSSAQYKCYSCYKIFKMKEKKLLF